MRMVQEKSKVEVDGEVENAKIVLGGKAYSILTTQIYRDRMRALIRELSCNAVDSHVESENNEAIHVHLPSEDAPTFYVEDFGLGMNEEDVEIFTTFFESTKDMSNKQIGCLGLGSKVFYGYNTRTATVTATKNGVRRIYSFFMQDGIPSRTKLFEEKTDARNGVKIEFTVARNDINNFVNKSSDIFQWFQFPVEFLNVTPIIKDITKDKVLEGEGYYFNKSGGDAVVLMGNIPYAVEVSDYILELYRNFIENSGLVIEAPIGSVDFDPSREGLGYTKKTLVFLCKRFAKIQQELEAKIEQEINSKYTYYEAVIVANTLFSQSVFTHSGIQVVYHKNGRMIERSSYWSKILDKNRKYIRLRHFRYGGRGISDSMELVSYNTHTVFVVNDLKTGHISRIREYVKNNPNTKVCLIEPQLDQTLEDLYECIGIDESLVIKASTLDAPVKQTKAGGRQYVSNVMVFNPTLGYTATTRWRKEDNLEVTQTKGIFVVRSHFRGRVGGNLIYHDRLQVLLECLNLSSVYGVKEKDVPFLEKNGWVSLDSYIKNKYESKRERMTLLYCLKERGLLVVYNSFNNTIQTIIDFSDYFDDIKDDLALFDITEQDKKDAEILQNYTCRMIFESLFKDHLSKTKGDVLEKIDKARDNIEQKREEFPLLSGYNVHYNDPTKKEYEYYILGKLHAKQTV